MWQILLLIPGSKGDGLRYLCLDQGHLLCVCRGIGVYGAVETSQLVNITYRFEKFSNGVMYMIEKAILIATNAHNGQTDKAGKPYILHPLRVMMSVDSMDEKIVAVLHDVIEDTFITIKDIENTGFSSEVVAALDALTRRDGESYERFIVRVMTNRTACIVKLADLEDNMDLSRLSEVTEAAQKRLEKYKKAHEKIRKHLNQ